MLASVKHLIRHRIMPRLEHLTGRGKWDRHFLDWIDKAEAEGVDPNDVGDQAWQDDHLDDTLREFYLPYVSLDSVVLELGPGTGRVTRHLVGRCAKLELVDNSRFVTEWISRYLSGKCQFSVHRIDVPLIPDVGSGSVDTVIAHGVFEHLDFDEAAFYLDEFFRVLKPGGHVSLNYDTLHTAAGVEWFESYRKRPGERCVFRFYMPDFMARLGEVAGFRVHLSHVSEDRLAHIVFAKPEGPTKYIHPEQSPARAQ